MSQQKQIGLYQLFYADDHDGEWLLRFYDSYGAQEFRLALFPFFMYKAGLWTVAEGAGKLNRCPADPLYGRYDAGSNEVYNIRPQFNAGYAVNFSGYLNMVSNGEDATVAGKSSWGEVDWSDNISMWPDRLRNPSAFLVRCDGYGTNRWWNQTEQWPGETGRAASLGGTGTGALPFHWHNGRINALLADGHVESPTQIGFVDKWPYFTM